MKRTFLLIGFLILYGSAAYAGGTSQELYDECHKLENAPTDPKALIADVSCARYVDGVVDGYRIVTSLFKPARFICLPERGLSNDDVIKIFSKRYRKNPNDKSLPARSGVLLSLQDAYPCK